MNYLERIQAEFLASKELVKAGVGDENLVIVPMSISAPSKSLPRRLDLSDYGRYLKGANALEADLLVGIMNGRHQIRAPDADLTKRLQEAVERRARRRRAADALAPPNRKR